MPHDPWLLTPGPLTTSLSVKQAMLHDWGSRDAKFITINTRMRQRFGRDDRRRRAVHLRADKATALSRSRR